MFPFSGHPVSLPQGKKNTVDAISAMEMIQTKSRRNRQISDVAAPSPSYGY
jgi:hypothetical protein